jgi:tRNA dimethylallyltransferase
VWKLTGKPLSALQGAAQAELPFALEAMALVPDRALLKQKIERRFDAMLRLGLVDELKRLRAKYRLTSALPSMRAVGYRQVWEFLEGRMDHATMRERAVTATRQLAKRQLTWLRSFQGIKPIEPSPEALIRSCIHRAR